MTAPNNPTPEVELVERLRNPNFARSQTFSKAYMLDAAAAIERLTAERDMARGQLQRQFDQSVRFQGYLVDAKSRSDAAKKCLKNLEEEREEAVNRGFEMMNQLEAAEASNKLLSERIAVLEDILPIIWSEYSKGEQTFETYRALGRLIATPSATIEADNWEYKTIETPRKGGIGHDYYPEMLEEGWEADPTRGRTPDGWDRFDNHEELYFRRVLAAREAK